MKPCRMDIKILLALKKDVRTYAAGNLIYGVIFDILHVIVEYRLTKKTFHCVVAVLWKKILRKWVSCWMDPEGSLNFNFPVTSIKSNYRDIFSFPSKLTNWMVVTLAQDFWLKSRNPSDTLTYLKSYVWMLKYFALLKYGHKLQIF